MTRCAARGALIFGFTLLAGCAPDADREAVPVDGGPGAVEEVAETSARDRAGAPELPGETARERCKAFYEEGLAVAARTRSELREELGEPAAIEGETEPNRHDPARMDSLWTVRYDGLAAEIRTAGGNDLLERMTVTDTVTSATGSRRSGRRRTRLRRSSATPTGKPTATRSTSARRSPCPTCRSPSGCRRAGRRRGLGILRGLKRPRARQSRRRMPAVNRSRRAGLPAIRPMIAAHITTSRTHGTQPAREARTSSSVTELKVDG
jgi:hypothetical protein